MKYLLLAFYFLSSNQADFDGKNLIFSGKFQVEHPMGLLKAEKATLKDLQLHHPTKKGMQLFLEEGVSIESMKGKTPFAISSRSAFCELPPNTFLSFFQFQELQFYDEVKITTLLGIQAHGGSAFYKTGSLTLYPSIPLSCCQLERGLDRIEAQEIRFDLLKEELSCFKAHGILALREREPSLHFSTETLLWQKKEEKLYFQKDVFIEQTGQFSLYADNALLTFQNEFEPHLFWLEGNVRLFSPQIQDKESFSVADQIAFYPQERKIILSSLPPKRVLFWQEGFSLSAPEVWIERDPLTGKETIEGKGDVHFAFDSEEKNIIEQLLSKYL